MPNLNWDESRNLEHSLVDFLINQISTQNKTVFFDGKNLPINARVGFPEDNKWILPVISVYVSSKTATRDFVGTNKRTKERLMIIQIRALDDGMRQDLADWVADTINEGFLFFDYQPSESTPDLPTKTQKGKVGINFVTDAPTRLLNVEDFDKFLHNISISVEIN